MPSKRVRILMRLQALGESYLALRGELGEVLDASGIAAGAPPAEAQEAHHRRRRDILDRLERGEIRVDEAVRALEAVPPGQPLAAQYGE